MILEQAYSINEVPQGNRVIMNCDFKGNFDMLAFGLGFYLCLAFDDEELLMHFG